MSTNSSHPQGGSEHDRLHSLPIHDQEAIMNDTIEKTREIMSIFQKHEKLECSETWLSQLDRIQTITNKPSTIIAIRGTTGVGKSSVVNAILGLDGLVPTSSIRACTSVITSISYSESGFCAEIVFIDKSSWQEEVEQLLEDLRDDNGKLINQEQREKDSPAAIAYAKLKCVYPFLTNGQLESISAEELMGSHLLPNFDSPVKISCSALVDFRSKLKDWIESPDKRTEDQARWPLIKAVNLFVPAEILSTGITLVDLPGDGDSNPARAALGASYMQNCSALIIATPIHRAVDDSVGKELLGDFLRRQLRMDGSLSTVMIVCTKTDQIVTNEVERELNLTAEIKKERAVSENEEVELKSTKEELKQVDAQIRKLRALKATKIAQNPELKSNVGNKRKRNTSSTDISKNLTEATRNSGAIAELEGLQSRISELNERQKLLKDQEWTLTHRPSVQHKARAICIRARNRYATEIIQRDFAGTMQGIREDRTKIATCTNTAIEWSMKEVDPPIPVFCVSAHVFNGLIESDNVIDTTGFDGQDDTEIPKLRNQIRKLPDSARASTTKEFFEFSRLEFTRLAKWSSKIQPAAYINKPKEEKIQLMDSVVTDARKKFDSYSEEFSRAIKHSLDRILNSPLEQATKVACIAAEKTILLWGQNYSWPTYKATTRRYGKFKNRKGYIDFNNDLADPIIKHVSKPWDFFFNVEIPRLVKKSYEPSQSLIAKLKTDLLIIAGKRRVMREECESLCRRFETYNFETIDAKILQMVRNKQMEISRDIQCDIQSAMRPAYLMATREIGPGQLARMRKIILDYGQDSEMYKTCRNLTQEKIETMCTETAQEWIRYCKRQFEYVENAYRETVTGLQHRENSEDRQEQSLKREINGFLRLSDSLHRVFDRNLLVADDTKVKPEKKNQN